MNRYCEKLEYVKLSRVIFKHLFLIFSGWYEKMSKIPIQLLLFLH